MGAGNQQERVPKEREYLSYYIAGFVDGEGSFTVTIHKIPNRTRFGWTIDPFFQVYQHKDNSHILYVLKDFFSGGYVSKKGGSPSCFVYCMDKTSDLVLKIIPFFDQYPLIGEKHLNFLLFREIVFRLYRKEHFSKQGFVEIVKLCFKMNRNGYYRKRSLEEILSSLEKSPETTRQSPLMGMI
jgi:hypothetical protein